MTQRRPAPRAGRRTPSGQTTSAPPSRRARVATGAARVRIVVADNQTIDRAGIVGLLEREKDFEVVGESGTIEDTIGQCRKLDPDILVLTLNLPAQERGAAIPAIRTRLPGLRILALSERGAENCLVLNPPSRRWLAGVPLGTCPVGIDCLQLAAQQGAMATLRRNAEPSELARAIRAVAEGHAHYDPTTAQGMLAAPARRGRPLFSRREMQVAALITEARSNKEIATLLGIGEPTVKKHVGSILEKLGLADRLQAGLFLARNPLLLEPQPEP